ncbi:hypothetical protein [Geothrix sp. 21YS21S-2]|uniref:hypothetical protein n=1 Tax=Geothrix sp. 21YS21S-2 TaxID=3068893 RepID=UPI0027B8B9E8|nr:hypothetical protein [Geothrix sp. 21YS21S-2]
MPPSIRIFPLVIGLATGLWGQDRTELVNRSGQPWTLALAEGAKPGRGSLTLLDKFTGKVQAELAKVGESVTLPPQGRFLVIFNRSGGYLFRDFLLKDAFGFYAEYVASVEFLSAPNISIQLVDHHVGPPMDRSDDGAIKQYVMDAITLGSGNIIIHHASLKGIKAFGQSYSFLPSFEPVELPTN